jgi:hypothetical protein
MNTENKNSELLQRFIGKQFKHKNGNIYTVLFLTNIDSTPEHPIDVVYMGQNGKIWSRRLSDWDRSFTLLNENKIE